VPFWIVWDRCMVLGEESEDAVLTLRVKRSDEDSVRARCEDERTESWAPPG
jgi:hypothetical protein